MSADESVREQARYWLVRQQSGDMDKREQAALQAWLQADERHRREYEQVAQLWHAMEEFKGRSFPARRAAQRHHGARVGRVPMLRLASGAAVLGVLALLFVSGLVTDEYGWNTPQAEIHRTAKGERDTVTLADGSRIELNTDTELRVAYTRKARTVHLDRGEALFTVTADPARPFEVRAGSGRIVDLSTSFNVYRQDREVEVAVTEGAVSISTVRTGPIHLVRGDALSYGANGEFLSQRRIDPQSALAWREGRIKFDRTPLGEVMAQLARYHPISWSFADAGIADMRISGSFRSDDIELLLDTLEAALPVQAGVDGRHIRFDRAVN